VNDVLLQASPEKIKKKQEDAYTIDMVKSMRQDKEGITPNLCGQAVACGQLLL
jgi:hypothetical protein